MEQTKKSIFGKKTMDMTDGKIFPILLRFAFPLFLGNLFQQLYNIVDAVVIGQNVEATAAYSAVGSVAPVINILIGFFLGFSSGASVVISQHFGAGNKENIEKAVHTSMALTVLIGILFTGIGILMTPTVLRWMLDNPENDVYMYAKDYLIIYFCGLLPLFIYNMGSAILRSIGDSVRPFYFLLASAVINTGLDLLFVVKFGWGVKGVAYATVIAETVSAVLALAAIMRTDTDVKFSFKKMRIDKKMLAKISWLGFPAGIQIALTAFSNVFVQSYIGGVNGIKIDGVNENALGGWTTYTKIDQFIFLPLQSLAVVVTTFVGQNLGKGDVKRARRGTTCAYLMATGITVFLIGLIEILAPYLPFLFTDDTSVAEDALTLLRFLTPFYILCCINQIFSGALRGAGETRAPMIAMLAAFVGSRQVYLYLMKNHVSNDLIPIAMGYPFGWFVCALIILTYYLFYKFDPSKVTGKHTELSK